MWGVFKEYKPWGWEFQAGSETRCCFWSFHAIWRQPHSLSVSTTSSQTHVCYNIVLHCQRLWFTPHEAVQSQGSHNITINFYHRYPARREVHLPSESKQLKGKCYQETELSLTLPCCLSFIPASDTQSWITALVVIRFRSSGRPVTLHSRKHFIITRGWQRLVQMQLIKAVRFFSSFGQWRVMQRNSLHIFTSVTTDRFFLR